MIIATKDPLPALLAIRVELFLDSHLTSSAGFWVFETHRAHSIANVLKPLRRRLYHFVFRVPRLIGPLLLNLHPTRRPGRLPRQKASYFRRNGAAFAYLGGCELADRY